MGWEWVGDAYGTRTGTKGAHTQRVIRVQVRGGADHEGGLEQWG